MKTSTVESPNFIVVFNKHTRAYLLKSIAYIFYLGGSNPDNARIEYGGPTNCQEKF